MYTFQGVTDNVTECGLCGRTDLKRTIVVQDDETGDTSYFGTSCAGKALSWRPKRTKRTAAQAWSKFIATKQRREREAKFILKQTFGQFFKDEFRKLYSSGTISRDHFGGWRTENRNFVTDHIKNVAEESGLNFSFPGNFYIYNELCEFTLLPELKQAHTDFQSAPNGG